MDFDDKEGEVIVILWSAIDYFANLTLSVFWVPQDSHRIAFPTSITFLFIY